MINAKSLDNVEWDSLSLVIGFFDGGNSTNGYSYNGEKYKGWIPSSSEFLRKIEELRVTMPSKAGGHWCKALIRVTKPDLNFTIDVDYDDQTRWDMEVKSIDLISDHANSLRPKNL